MAYVLPTFNLAVHIWTPPAAPPAAPTIVTVGNMTPGKRVVWDLDISVASRPFMYLLLPAKTDVRTYQNGATFSLILCPVGSGKMYQAYFFDDVGRGFLNEHRIVYCIVTPVAWPAPTL